MAEACPTPPAGTLTELRTVSHRVRNCPINFSHASSSAQSRNHGSCWKVWDRSDTGHKELARCSKHHTSPTSAFQRRTLFGADPVPHIRPL